MPRSVPATPSPRVVFLPPLQAEKQAYALARYSRSGDPVEASLAWVETHSEEKFWKSFYFDYGHASIADLGHVATCFEDISELAGIEVLDEPLWDGQARSTRYQDFGAKGFVVPPELAGHELEPLYQETLGELLAAYRDVHARSVSWLAVRHPRPEAMDPKAYERNVAARAFDMARGLLPLGIPTSIGQVVSIRTLERQISRLLVSDLAEVRRLAEWLIEGCRAEPLGGGKPTAPTLARHARAFDWQRAVRERSASQATELLGSSMPARTEGTTLRDAPDADIEILASLMYEASGHPWAEIVTRVSALPAAERGRRVVAILLGRGPHDELPRACRAGVRHVFEIVMDVGGFRDMHRHRRCHQFLQPLDPKAGCALPPDGEEAGVASIVVEAHARAADAAGLIGAACGPRVAQYALPLAHLCRSLFKMDFAEADYIARLRSGIKGHPSYRRVAWDMFSALSAREPHLAGLLDATPPSVEDPLTR